MWSDPPRLMVCPNQLPVRKRISLVVAGAPEQWALGIGIIVSSDFTGSIWVQFRGLIAVPESSLQRQRWPPVPFNVNQLLLKGTLIRQSSGFRVLESFDPIFAARVRTQFLPWSTGALLSVPRNFWSLV